MVGIAFRVTNERREGRGIFPGQVIYNCPLPNTDHLESRVAVTATYRVTMLNRSKLPIDLASTIGW